MSAITVRVKKRGSLILGKVREFNEPLTEEEFNAINPVVRNAMESQGIIEVLRGDLTDDQLHQMMNDLSVKIRNLEERIVLVEGLLESAGRSELLISRSEIETQTLDRKARKGDKVEFEHDSDGNTFIIEGIVDRVSKGVAEIKGVNGNEYLVDVDMLTVLA